MSKKISIVIGKMSGGGAERVVSNLTDYLVTNNGDQIEIITLLNDKIDYNLPESVKLTYLATSEKQKFIKPIVWVKKLRKHFNKSKPDIILSFFVKINLLVIIASLGLRIPVYISERNDPKADRRSKFLRFLSYLLYPLSDGVIFQTKYARNCFPNYIHKKSSIIPNPINVNIDFNESKKLTKSIVSVGKLMEQKNHRLLINAFSQIANKYPDYNLYIYGDGPLKQSLYNIVSDLKLEDRIFLMGRTQEIYDIIYNSDMFVLSSNYEGLSNALLEAMALETPVISTNVAGSNEIIIDGVNGRLVEIGDCDGLARAMENNINDYNEAIKMAKNAKELVMELSSWKAYKKWDAILKNEK